MYSREHDARQVDMVVATVLRTPGNTTDPCTGCVLVSMVLLILVVLVRVLALPGAKDVVVSVSCDDSRLRFCACVNR